MIVGSWEGKQVEEIAKMVQCCAKTVRVHLKRLNEEGLEGLGERVRPGRPKRLSETERSRILAFASQAAPGSLQRESDGSLQVADEQASAQWSLDALTQAAQQAGIQVKRSQIRRIFLSEGVRWRRTHSWGSSDDEDFVPKGRRSSAIPPSPPKGRRPCAPMN
jgi:transposase